MKTQNLLMTISVAARAAIPINLTAGEALVSLRTKDNQIKTVPGVTEALAGARRPARIAARARQSDKSRQRHGVGEPERVKVQHQRKPEVRSGRPLLQNRGSKVREHVCLLREKFTRSRVVPGAECCKLRAAATMARRPLTR